MTRSVCEAKETNKIIRTGKEEIKASFSTNNMLAYMDSNKRLFVRINKRASKVFISKEQLHFYTLATELENVI